MTDHSTQYEEKNKGKETERRITFEGFIDIVNVEETTAQKEVCCEHHGSAFNGRNPYALFSAVWYGTPGRHY